MNIYKIFMLLVIKITDEFYRNKPGILVINKVIKIRDGVKVYFCVNDTDIHYYYDKIDNIIPIVISSNFIYDKNSDMFDCKCVLGEKYYLYDVNTINKFGLRITKMYVKGLFYHAHIDVLEWWRNSKYVFEYDAKELCFKSEKSLISLLEWWKNTNEKTKYSTYNLKWGSLNGLVGVLEWWCKSNLELEYDEDILNTVSANNDFNAVNVLHWWLNSNLPLKYSELAMGWASSNGHIDILKWWFKSNLPLKYDDWSLRWASWKGHLHVLDWWLNSGLPLNYGDDILDLTYPDDLKFGFTLISETDHIKVLEWWKKSGLTLKYTEWTLLLASHYGYKNVLEWWFKSNLPLKYNKEDILETCDVDILEWWRNAKLL
jgi:hypothetical protein